MAMGRDARDAGVIVFAMGNGHLPAADVRNFAMGNGHLPTADVRNFAMGNGHLPTADVRNFAMGRDARGAGVVDFARGNGR